MERPLLSDATSRRSTSAQRRFQLGDYRTMSFSSPEAARKFDNGQQQQRQDMNANYFHSGASPLLQQNRHGAQTGRIAATISDRQRHVSRRRIGQHSTDAALRCSCAESDGSCSAAGTRGRVARGREDAIVRGAHGRSGARAAQLAKTSGRTRRQPLSNAACHPGTVAILSSA